MRLRAAVEIGLVAAVLAVPHAAAQDCRGLPGSPHGWVGMRLGQVAWEDPLVGGELGLRPGLFRALVLGGDRVRFGDGVTADRLRLGVEVVVEPDGLSVPLCLTAAGSFAVLGDLHVLTLPVGLALGWSRLVGQRLRLVGHVEPRVAYRRAWLGEFYRVTAPTSVVAGAGVMRGWWYGGVGFEWTSAERQAWSLGLRLVRGF